MMFLFVKVNILFFLNMCVNMLFVGFVLYNCSILVYEVLCDLSIFQFLCMEVLKKVMKDGVEKFGIDFYYF